MGVLVFPQDRELIYIFEKTDNLPELERLYNSVLQKKYSKDIDLKYVKVLLKLNKKEGIPQSERFFRTYKDKKFLDYVLNVFAGKKDYKHYEKFLNLGFKLLNDTLYLKKLLSLYSFQHNNEKLIKTVKLLYEKTGDEKWLDTLYGLGETDFTVKAYLKEEPDKLDMKKIKRILYYFSEKKDYESYIKFLSLAYKKTNDIKYLIEKKNIYSFLKMKKQLIKTVKQLYQLTEDETYLDTLYSLGAKDYVIKIFEKNVKNLTLKQKRKLATYYLWSSNLEKLMNFYKNEIGYANLNKEEEKRLIALFSYFSKYSDLIEFYKTKYKLTKDIKYLKDLGETYDYYGIGVPDKVSRVFYKVYELTKDKKFLNRIISMYLALSDSENYLKYSLIKLKNFYSEKLLKEIVGFLISNNKMKQAEKLTETYLTKDENLLHFLFSVYMMQGKQKKALNLLLQYKPLKLNRYELSFIANTPKIIPKFFPYLERYFLLTKEKFYIAKILKYYAANKAFYKFNRLFKKYFGKVNNSNYLFYLDLIPEKFSRFKRNEVIRLVKTSFNPDFLNNLGLYIMGLNEQNFAKIAFKKVLFFDKNNFTALEQLGKIYYWQQNFSASLKTFLKYDNIKNNNPVIKFYIGEILYNRKKRKEAEKYLQYVVKNIKKDGFENKMIYLKSYVMLHGINDVIDEYREAVKESGFDKDIYADFLDALLFSQNYETLAEEYNNFKKTDKFKKNIRILRIFAMFNIETEHFKEAKKLLDRAYLILKKSGVKNSTVLSDYGYLYYMKGDRFKALRYYKKALAMDKKNRDIAKIVRELEDEFSRNITVAWEYKNKVEAKKTDLNIPVQGKYWVGLSYNLYKSDKAEIYLKLQDINKNKFTVEAGKKHFYFSFGNKYRVYYSDTLFTDYKTAVDEDLMSRKIGAKISGTLKSVKMGFNMGLSKNFYRNKNGKIASTVNFDSDFSFNVYKDIYFSTGFNYVKLNYYNKEKTDVFFSDYRAINFFLSKYYNYEEKKTNWNWSIGTIYDLISKKYNYAGNIYFNIGKKLYFNYNIYYDAFSREQVDSIELKWKITF